MRRYPGEEQQQRRARAESEIPLSFSFYRDVSLSCAAAAASDGHRARARTRQLAGDFFGTFISLVGVCRCISHVYIYVYINIHTHTGRQDTKENRNIFPWLYGHSVGSSSGCGGRTSRAGDLAGEKSSPPLFSYLPTYLPTHLSRETLSLVCVCSVRGADEIERRAFA